MVVHFMLDQRKPFGFPFLCKSTAIEESGGKRNGNAEEDKFFTASYQFITEDTDLLCYSVPRMFNVTEEMLVLAKQAQKLLTKYNVPVAKVADMIYEGTVEMVKVKNGLFNPAAQQDKQGKKVKMGDLSKTSLFFAARRHLYKQKVYVVRITYRFQKTSQLKQKYSVVISGVEIMKEKDYKPVLPM
jgi:hypothetical protein